MERFTALAGLGRSNAVMSPKELEDVDLERKLELFELDYVLPGTVDALTRLVAHHLARHLRADVRRLKLYRHRRRTNMQLARTLSTRVVCHTWRAACAMHLRLRGAADRLRIAMASGALVLTGDTCVPAAVQGIRPT